MFSRAYRSLLAWRGSKKGISPHPAFATLARADLASMMEGLSADDRRMLLWGVRIYHRTIMDMSDERAADGT